MLGYYQPPVQIHQIAPLSSFHTPQRYLPSCSSFSVTHMSSITLPKLRHQFSPPQSYSAAFPRPDISPSLTSKRRRRISLKRETGSYAGGLRTPPAEDDMSATCHNLMVAGNTYDSHVALARHQNAMLPSSRLGGGSVMCGAAANPYPRSQSHTQPPPQLLTTYALRPQPSMRERASTQPPSPISTGTLSSCASEDPTMVMHSLEMPKCISPNGGSLDYFAALVSFDTFKRIRR